MARERNQPYRDSDYPFLSFSRSRSESVTAAAQLLYEVSYASRELQSP